MKGRIKIYQRILACFLVAVMLLTGNLAGAGIVLAATGTAYTITPNVTTGDINKFTFSPASEWKNSASEAYAEVTTSTANPQNIKAEFTFIGNRIEVYGNKAPVHGICKYYIDDVLKATVDSYAASRTSAQLFAYGFTDGDKQHTLRIEATGTANAAVTGGRAVAQFGYVKLWHSDYVPTDFTLENSLNLVVGQTKTITTATITPSYASMNGATYTPETAGIIEVLSNGQIKGLKAGSTKVNVTHNGVTKSINVTVGEAVPQLGGNVVDTNSHYDQSTYNTVKALNKKTETLSAWKGDKALSEIALYSVDSALSNVTVTAGDFTSGTNKIAATNVETKFLKETKAYLGDAGYHGGDSDGPQNTPSDDAQKTMVPDIIYSSNPVSIDFNKVQPVWVAVNVPRDAVAGTYTGNITVKADGVAPQTFTYTLEVQNALLPEISEYTFDFEGWQYPYSIAEYYEVEPFSEEHMAILRTHMAQYKNLGSQAITTSIVDDAWNGQTYSANEIHYPSMIQWIKQADGTFTYNYDHFDKWVGLNKELGIGDKIVLYSIASWSGKIRYYDEATKAYVTVNPGVGSTQYTTMWKDFLQKLVAHLDEKGWFDNTYMGIDERGFSTTAFDLVESVKGRNAKSLKISGAMDAFTSKAGLAARVDDLSIGTSAVKAHYTEFKALVKEREALGKKTTMYTCTEHFPNSEALSMPGESYWTMLFSASQGGQGLLRWAYDAWVADPLRDTTHWAFEAGDCFLVYPDEKNATNPTSKASVRIEKLSEGVRDVNKLQFMVREIPSLKTDVDELYATLNLNYGNAKNGIGDHGGMRLANATTKTQLPVDMKAFKDGIKSITDKYISIKAGGVTTVDSVAIVGGNASLQVGEEKTYTATVLPANTINKDVTWESNNTNAVTVTQEGKVVAVSRGTATIKAISKSDETKFATVTVTVTVPQIDAAAQVAYYSFDAIGTDKAVKDSWGSANGILTGGTIVDGLLGKAVQFGANDKIEITAPQTLSNSWSISMWVKAGAITAIPSSVMWDGNNMDASDKNSESLDVRMNASNEMGVHVKAGFLTFRGASLEQDTWRHLTWVNDKTKGIILYIDGVKKVENNYTVSNAFNAPLKVIGGRNFVGVMDEVKVFNCALTAEEIPELKKLPGMNVDVSSLELKEGATFTLTTDLVANVTNKTITYTSADSAVATVDSTGTVTAKRYGDTVITVSNAESGFSKTVSIRVTKDMILTPTIPLYDYPVSKQILIDRQAGQYLGQPDTVMLDDNKTLLTVYPKNHGLGATILKKSTDMGSTWSERISEIPASWANSQETPTIYKLDFKDGSQKLIMITGCPGWGDGSTGWNSSISNDSGTTWTEYKHFYTGRKTIVAMASLVHLKDANGNYIDKWMGVYHDYGYVNYKTYLTFDAQGNEQWSEPEPYLSQYRSIESQYQICEVGMFRSPDGNRIVALARSQSHSNLSTMFYSDDEGMTWSKPREVHGSLLGERHKAAYDPISGRLVITFREIILDNNKNGKIENGDWMAGDWLAWVGTYEDLMGGKEGQYRIRLAEDFTPTAKSGDTGYAGNVVNDQGTFFLNSYGNFDKTDTSNKPYIIGIQFKLAEIDKTLGIETEVPTDVKVTGVSLAPTTASLKVNETKQLTATVAPVDAKNKAVSYASNNEAVATVSASGLVTAKAKGTAIITVTTQDGNKTATCTVTVTENVVIPPTEVKVTGVTLSPTTASLKVNETKQLTATVAPADAKNKAVSYASNNAAVAAVSATGLVTAKAKGTATITVTTTDGNKTATCVITVEETQSTITKEDVRAEITIAEAKKQEDYSPESWKAFQDAIKEAEVVLANNAATQEQITEAKNNLTDAMNNLSPVVPTGKTGWYVENGKDRYYENNQVVANKWVKDEVTKKWMYAGKEGYKSLAWVSINGKWYYMGTDGFMKTGWVTIGKDWYYLDAYGVMQTKWLKFGGAWYYLQSSGKMKTGWLNDGGAWYFLQGSGKMKTGWLKDGGAWYYLQGSGKMKTGWLKDGGAWYYLQGSGKMKTGWLKVGSSWYYLLSSGKMATGWVNVGGIRYYLTPGTGIWNGQSN